MFDTLSFIKIIFSQRQELTVLRNLTRMQDQNTACMGKVMKRNPMKILVGSYL